ncbi:MAG TPA: MFS transporter [Gammaproteobacteria bacterium]|nr:MFS transporter [Gammaproteobacteria bacterium]
MSPDAHRHASSRLPPIVWLLGAVSLLNDAASEMITPLLPLLLTTQMGGGATAVALVEGTAEAASSLIKLVSGWIADRTGAHRPLVIGGYLLSNLSRPLIGLAPAWGTVLGLRFLDRAGKGLRTAPRDVILTAGVATGDRGRAFGLHRAMDHCGAILGPLLALPLLNAGLPMQHVFLFSAAPGVLVLLMLLWGLPAAPPIARNHSPPVLSWRMLDARLKALIFAAVALTLSTLPEAFLILWAAQGGMTPMTVALLWSLAHVVKVTSAYLAGVWSDRRGRLPVMIAGWGVRVIVLLLIATGLQGTGVTWALFLFYAGALASTEAAERALIGDNAPEKLRGTVFGLYHLTCGLLVLPGVAALGWLWEHVSPRAALLTAAAGTLISVLVLLILVRPGSRSAHAHE